MITFESTPASAAPGGTEDDRVVRGGWYTLYAMLGLMLFAFVDRQVITLAAAPIAAELRLTDSQLGLVLGLAFAVFGIIAVYPIAWAADRFDRRYVLAFCVVAWSAGTAACGLAQNFKQLFLAVVAIAAGESGLGPVMLGIIPELFFGRKRVLANSLNYVFSSLGISAGFILGGYAMAWLDGVHANLPESLRHFSSWRLSFFIVASPAPMFLLLLAFARLDRSAAAVDTAVADPVSIGPFVREHIRPIGFTLGAIIFNLLAFGGFLAWLPTANTRLFGTSAATNGFGMGIASAAGTLAGVAIATVMMRRFMSSCARGSEKSVRVAYLVTLVGTPILLAFPAVTAAWHVFVLFGLLMVPGTCIGSLVPLMLQDMAPRSIRTRFLAIYIILSALFAGSAPSVVGWLSTSLGGSPHDLLNAITIVAIPCWVVAGSLFRATERPFAELLNSVMLMERAAGSE